MLDDIDDDNSNLEKTYDFGTNKGDWAFFYFGYSFNDKKAYGYLKYYETEESFKLEKLNHFLPSYFHFYLGNDKIYPKF